MLYTLAAPVRGATHVEVKEVAVNLSHGFAVLRASLGAAASDGLTLDSGQPSWDTSLVIQDDQFQELRGTVPQPDQLTLAQLVAFVGEKGLWT